MGFTRPSAYGVAIRRKQMTSLQKIHDERKRQIDEEGWTADHDNQHKDGELLRAAVLYYANAIRNPDEPPMRQRADGAPVGWPWEAKWWKPKGRERDLIRAGALCLAERERLRRIRGIYRGHVVKELSMIVAALDRHD